MRGSCLIVGAGLGGLATAVRLQHAGWKVTVLEKNERIGGRCNLLQENGFTFDTGPTLLLMRDVLDELFRSVGRDLSDYLDLVLVQPNYRVRFADGSSVLLSSDLDRPASRFQAMASELDALEPGAGLGLQRYLADAAYKYRIARERFVERNFLRPHHFLTPANLYYLFATNTMRKLDRHASRYFRDPRLVSAFTFQTMYLGLAPHHAPAVYSLLPYTELAEGIWFPRGGMYRIVAALERLADELGVRIETGAEVAELTVEGSRVRGVKLANGDRVSAEVVVSNADLPYTYGHLLPPGSRTRFTTWRMPRLSYGSSAFLLYLGLDCRYPQLNHHDVYLSGDVGANFDAIFRRLELPEDPSFYTCAPSRTDPTLAPPGHDAIYVLVPVPHLSVKVDWRRERDGFRERVYDRLEAAGLRDLRRHLRFERVYTPLDFASDYNLARGSAFGISHNFLQVGYMRPANKAPRLEGLYFVGASTQPGGGVPMVIIGSRLTAERIEGDRIHG